MITISAPWASGTTYITQSDAGVACLKRTTGEVLWRRHDTFREPRLWIEDGRLTVEEQDPPRGRIKVVPRRDGTVPEVTPRIEAFDLETGKPTTRGKAASRIEPVARLPRQLQAASGLTLAFDPGNTENIETTGGKVLERLGCYPDEMLLAGDVVILTGCDGLGGDVYGWDLDRGAEAWQLDLRRFLPKLRAGANVDVALDGSRLLVSVDRRILSFALHEKPRLLWKTSLPRRPVRAHDTASTAFARHGRILFAVVDEDLFALRASDGELLWHFDAGAHAHPWPVAHDGRVCTSFRKAKPKRRR